MVFTVLLFFSYMVESKDIWNNSQMEASSKGRILFLTIGMLCIFIYFLHLICLMNVLLLLLYFCIVLLDLHKLPHKLGADLVSCL